VGLLRCLPRGGVRKDRERLDTIPGFLPQLGADLPACVFVDRCGLAQDICRREEPPFFDLGGGRQSRCHFWEQAHELPRAAPAAGLRSAIDTDERPVIRTEGVRKTFHQEGHEVRAVDDINLALRRGETLGLVGESGSGKTTTGRCILRLVEPTSGEVRFKGEDVLSFPRSRMRQARRDMQIVFQDPYSSLNPRMRAGAIVEEPLIIHRTGSKSERRARVAELFELVGLDPTQLTRYPHQFSGGQRQRIGLARALALNPSFVIADEPVSALDVSVQAQIINLLMDLQARLQLTYLFIAHDLRLVRHICSRVAVMYLGKIVEIGPTGRLFAAPAHPYTRALLSAIPVPDPKAERQRIVLDPESFNQQAPLREIAAGHLAAL
jgi:peptide/nickel transport system ATP-binding protein